jgi:4-amino-4-deoxy-L-arabinose transferase-like glycosyltransferase
MTPAPKTAEGTGRTVHVVTAKRLAPQGGWNAARWALVVVGALTTAGLLLRLPSFDDALFGDELATYFIVTGNSFDRVIWLLQGNSATGDLSPPLFFLVAAVTERLGHTTELLRLSSLVAGTAAIPLTYVLGLWTVGRRAALVGTALMALSPFLIFYSTEARAYALVMLLVLLSTLALVRALDTGRLGWWVAYAVCSCAAMYTHYPAVFVLAAQFAWAFWTRPNARRALLAANVAAAAGYIPWLPTLLDNTGSPGSDVIGFLHPFSLTNVRTDLGRWFLGHPYISLTSMPGPVAIAMLGAGLVAGLLGLALNARRGVRSHDSSGVNPGLVLVLVLAIATPLLVALYSSIGDSVWGSRYLIASWPGLALAVGALLTSGLGIARLIAVGLVLGAFGIGAVQMLRADSQRPDYKAVARSIESFGSRGDPVVEMPQPTPGPLTPVGDVALNHFRQSKPERYPVLRLGFPPRAELLGARPYASPPVPSTEAIARQAADLARHRRLFVVVPAGNPLALLLLGGFQGALPRRLHAVETRSFSGFVQVAVVVYRDSSGASESGQDRARGSSSSASPVSQHRPGF